MAANINADTSGGLKLTSDTSGVLELKSAGTTIATVNSTGLAMASGKTLPATTAVSLTTASGSAPSFSARAWVSFNGTGTVSIFGSGNISSITDNGTGLYTLNYATAMPDTNYAIVGSAGDSVATMIVSPRIGLINAANTSIRLSNTSVTGDNSLVGVTILR